MTVFDSLVVILVLVGLGILAYCKLTSKTLLDVFREIKEMISPTEEVTI